MTYEIPPPPSVPRGEPTGSHANQAPEPPFLWRGVIASVLSALIIAGGAGLVTWGTTSAELAHTRASVDRIREQTISDRQRVASELRALELAQARTDVTVATIKDLLIEINRRLGRIEERLESPRRR